MEYGLREDGEKERGIEHISIFPGHMRVRERERERESANRQRFHLPPRNQRT
jgi:hypothetical protein